MLQRFIVGPLVFALFLIACADQTQDPVSASAGPQFAAKPGDPGDASDRMLYRVKLAAQPGSRSQGIILIEIVGGYITATVHATGLNPNTNVPQHIHVNPTCSPGGGILLNLDANLTVAGEAPSTGAAYPMSNQAGVVNYYAERSLADLMTAANTFRSAGVTSIEDLLSWLNLEERNGHMHVSVSPFTPLNCGEVVRVN